MFGESHLGHLKLFWFSELVELGVELVVVDEEEGDGEGEEVKVPSKILPLMEIFLSPDPKFKPAAAAAPPRSS